jgi:hypothetical protein
MGSSADAVKVRTIYKVYEATHRPEGPADLQSNGGRPRAPTRLAAPVIEI